MRLRLIRHATLLIEYAGKRLLVDPMLDDPGARPPIENSPNPRNNPLVPLPEPVPDLLRGVDAILVTHTHSDHWDSTAAKVVPKASLLLGQPEDEAKFRSQDFSNVRPIRDALNWNGISILRAGGQHGSGEIAKLLAPVSGFILRASGEPTLYIAGDTILCDEVRNALASHKPHVIVVNAGGARFLEGGPITMTPDDVIQVCRAAPQAQVIADHMEAINHCIVTRDDLAFQLEAARATNQVAIPNDGEWVKLSA